LANVLSDLSGATGQAIIKAILGGERDPHVDVETEAGYGFQGTPG